jgi:hypothetical protein
VRSLTRDVILRALSLLGEQLPAGRPAIDLIVVGGAAMVLLFAARDAHGLAPGPTLLDTPTLRVRTVSTEQLLAMKLSAWRDDLDVEDARRLLQECRDAREEIWRHVERHVVPGRELKARYAFDDLWESQHGAP